MGKKNKGDAKRVKVSIPADLADAVEATGADLDETVEQLLREAFERPGGDRKGRLTGFIQELAGPHLPQLEAIAKDVASKVAKDVATAAATAAHAAFTAKTVAEKDKSAEPEAKRSPRNGGPKPPSGDS